MEKVYKNPHCVGKNKIGSNIGFKILSGDVEDKFFCCILDKNIYKIKINYR